METDQEQLEKLIDKLSAFLSTMTNAEGIVDYLLGLKEGDDATEYRRTLKVMVEQSKILNADTLLDLMNVDDHPWAEYAIKWGIAEYMSGNVEIGHLLCMMSLDGYPRLTKSLRMTLGHRYISSCFPEVAQWPNFVEVTHWAFTQRESPSTTELAQDFVALLHEPSTASAGARELFDDLAKVWQDRQ